MRNTLESRAWAVQRQLGEELRQLDQVERDQDALQQAADRRGRPSWSISRSCSRPKIGPDTQSSALCARPARDEQLEVAADDAQMASAL